MGRLADRALSPAPMSALGLLASFPRHLVAGVAAGPHRLGRSLLLLAALPLLLLLWAVHGLALLLDELWFPGYRRIRVREPLFVVGLPRSGTSALQGILADDPGLTTLRLWELLFAPAISERRAIRALLRLDARVGGPLNRARRALERRLVAFMEEVHPVALEAPEEDYLLLAPAFACFLLVLPFPRSRRVWALTRIDGWSAPARRSLARLYRALIQRHLHEAGGEGELRLLSKNPMFTPFVRTLAECFPDAHFIGCVRDPRRGLPSLLSSLEEGAAFFGWSPADPEYRDRFVAMMAEFGERLLELEGELGRRFALLDLEELRLDLPAAVESLWNRFGRPLHPTLRRALQARAAESRGHTSRHEYRLSDYGLDVATVESLFRSLICRLDAPPSGPESR